YASPKASAIRFSPFVTHRGPRPQQLYCRLMSRRVYISLLGSILFARVAAAQPAAPPDQMPAEHQHQHDQSAASVWQYMQDGVAWATFNRQGRPRGETDFRSQNWYMGMGTHALGPGVLTLTGMF